MEMLDGLILGITIYFYIALLHAWGQYYLLPKTTSLPKKIIKCSLIGLKWPKNV
jgi:hypothetical protein